MEKVAISELRQHLPEYMARVRKGEAIQITQHGKVVARIVPERDVAAEAHKEILRLRKTAKIGDVFSPIGDVWEAERDPV